MPLIWTGSRSSWIAFVIIMLLYVVKTFRKKITIKKVLITVIIIGSVIMFFVFTSIGKSFLEAIGLRVKYTENSFAQLQRIGSWKYLLTMYLTEFNPLQLLLGYGHKGSYDVLLRTTIYIPGFTTADNTYVANLFNYGIVNVVFIVALIVRVFKTYFYTKSHTMETICASIISCSIICVFIECNLFLNVALHIYFFCGMFISYSKSNRYKKNSLLNGD